jgi:hypothetical protein
MLCGRGRSGRKEKWEMRSFVERVAAMSPPDAETVV